MSRIRLLFAPENIGFADKLKAALASQGYEATAEDEPVSAVLVVWSPAAATSPTILSAARSALARRVLVPVALGKSPPPPSFEHLWPMDLAGWSGREEDPRWRFVLDEIELAVRRGVDFAPAAPAPVAAAPKPILDLKAPAPAAKKPAPSAPHLEDIFAEPAAYQSGARSRPLPQIPRAAIAAGVAVIALAGVTTTALILGRPSPAPVVAEEKSGGAVVAFVAPKDQPADEPTAPPIAVDAPATAPDEPPADQAGAGPAALPAPVAETAPEPLRDSGALAELAAPAERAPESDAGEPRVKPATIGALAEAAVGETANAAPGAAEPPPAGEADKIAELTWTSTSSEAEAVSFGNYFRDCVDCPDMAEIDAGSFTMGSAETEPGRGPAELPATPFVIRKNIAVAVRETTFDDWQACVADGACAPRPDHGWGRGKRPVINVSWSDAQGYAQWLSAKTGRRYRLPTEAEWEYAARSGSAASFAFGDQLAADKANYGALRGRTTPVGSYAANAFGLYDMHGNVAEWTADCWAPTLAGEPTEATPVGGLCSARVIKGGAWNDGGADLRAAHRDGDAESARTGDIGFRVVRDLN